LVGDVIFKIDLKAKTLGILSALPKGIAAQPIRKLARGHLTIPIHLGEQVVDALFDTGADITVIDSEYVQGHAQLFELVRSEEGTDAHGHRVQSNVYRCRTIIVGQLRLVNVEMASFDFGEFLRERMEGSPVILGNNVISRATWSFDMKAAKWASEPN